MLAPPRKRSSSSSSDQTTTLTTIIPKNIKPLPPMTTSPTLIDTTNNISNSSYTAFNSSSSQQQSSDFNNTTRIYLSSSSGNRLILIKNLNQIPLNGRFVFNDEESRRLIAIFRTKKNKIYAIDEYCYHMGGPLEKGDIEDLMVNYKDSKTRKHSCVVCPWHHYYISLKTGESFYLDIDHTYKSKGQRQRTYPLYYNSETMDLYLELDSRLELSYSPTVNCTGCESDKNPIKPLDSDHYVKIHQQKYSNIESSNTKPHSVVNLKELKEKRELKKINPDIDFQIKKE